MSVTRRSLRKALLIALSGVMLQGVSNTVHATTYTPVLLKDSVGKAGVIASGTVVDIIPREVESTVVSTVVFKDVVYLRDRRGQGRDTLEIRVLGGYVGGHGVTDEGGPRFAVGTRYVMLLDAGLGTKADGYTPIVYFNQGLFPIRREERTGNAVAHDWLYRPIAAVHNGRVVSVMPPREDEATPAPLPLEAHIRPTPAVIESLATNVPARIPIITLPHDRDPGTRLTESQFLAVILDLAGGQ